MKLVQSVENVGKIAEGITWFFLMVLEPIVSLVVIIALGGYILFGVL